MNYSENQVGSYVLGDCLVFTFDIQRQKYAALVKAHCMEGDA